MNNIELRGIHIEKDVNLSKKTWIKTGGVCSNWISPDSVAQLEEVCRYLYVNKVTFDLVGQTSNIFFHSTYNPQVVVSTVKLNNYKIEDDIVICNCGVNVVKLAKDCLAAGYAGFYGLVGLPGTVASAIVNNAGCFGCSISSMLFSADVLMPDGTIRTMMKDDFCFEKRSSVFKCGDMHGVILSVKLKLQKADSVEEEQKKAEETRRYRKTCQEGPLNNLGSVFSKMKRRKNLKNLITSIVVKLTGLIGFSNQKQVYKKMLLGLYGYTDLSTYISDKQINTFVWRDTDAEKMFIRYKEFMGKVYDGLVIEIEERV